MTDARRLAALVTLLRQPEPFDGCRTHHLTQPGAVDRFDLLPRLGMVYAAHVQVQRENERRPA